MRAIVRQMVAGIVHMTAWVAIAVFLSSVPARAQGTTVNAQYTGAPVAIDGQLGPAWASATPYPLAYTYGTSNFNPPTGACNAAPTMRALWDGNLLYVMISVTDPYISGGSSFAGDAAEFWVDHFNDKVQKFEEDDGTFVISAPNTSTNAVATSSNGTNAGDNIYPNLANRYLAGFKSALVSNGVVNTGYNVEFAWYIGDHVSAIGNHASLNGAKIGFDATVYEAAGPTGSTRSCRLMLSPAAAARTTNNNQPWGTIVLTGYNAGSSAPMQPDTFLLGVNIGAARPAAQVLPAGTTALPAVTNKATWAMASSSIWTDTTDLSNALTNAQTAMASTDQSVIDSADLALDVALKNLKRAGPYPYGGGPFPDPYALPDIPYLNDPFQFLDGSRVVSLADWDRRRAELQTLAQYYEYGWYPPSPAVSATSSGTGNTKTINITIVDNGHTWNGTGVAKLTLPNGTTVNGKTAPWPMIVSIDLAGTPGTPPAAYLNAGYAVLDIAYTQWANDGPTPSGAMNVLYPYDKTTGHDYGSLMGWAWGASRATDAVQYLMANSVAGYSTVNGSGQTVPLIDMDKLSVIGFSRCGKAALAAGFFDKRFKVTAPGGSGNGGAAPYRYAADNNSPHGSKDQFGHVYWWEVPPYTNPGQSNGGEAMGDHIRHNTWNTNELSRSFLNDNEPGPRTYQPRMYRQYTWGYGTRLPFDHHLVIAAIAPRAVLIDDSSDDYADEAEGDAVGYEGALPVFRYLGAQQNLTLDTVMEANNPASHSLKTTQQTNFLRFLDFELYGIPLPNTIPSGSSSFVIPGQDLPTNVQLYTDHFLTGAVNNSSIYDYYYGGFSTMMPWLDSVPHANLLTGLTLSAGTLNPAFSSGSTSYIASVPHAVTSIQVTPTAEDPRAGITVNGQATTSGQASPAIALSVGVNTIDTVVTAVDGATRKYSVAVTRLKLNQTITFNPLPDVIVGVAPLTMHAVGGGSSSPVTYSASGNCTAGGVNGGTITITGVGNCTVTASQAGDADYYPAADVSRSFKISYGITPLYDASRAVHAGSTLPVKLQLTNASGGDVSSPAIVVTAVQLVFAANGATLGIDSPGNSNPDGNFRFDPGLGPTGGYILNLKTQGLASGSYLLVFTAAGDPVPHSLAFQVK